MSVICVSVAVAAILVSKSVPATVNIIAVPGLEVLDQETGLAVESLTFGDMHRGENKYADKQIFLKNTGEIDLYFAWSAMGIPNDCTLTAEYYIPASNTWNDWPENNYGTLGSIGPTGWTNAIRFSLTLGTSAPFGAYEITITFNGADTPTG